MSLDTYEKLRHAIEEALDADGYRNETGDYMIVIDRGKVVDIEQVHVDPYDNLVLLRKHKDFNVFTVENLEDIE